MIGRKIVFVDESPLNVHSQLRPIVGKLILTY